MCLLLPGSCAERQNDHNARFNQKTITNADNWRNTRQDQEKATAFT